MDYWMYSDLSNPAALQSWQKLHFSLIYIIFVVVLCRLSISTCSLCKDVAVRQDDGFVL